MYHIASVYTAVTSWEAPITHPLHLLYFPFLAPFHDLQVLPLTLNHFRVPANSVAAASPRLPSPRFSGLVLFDEGLTLLQ